MNRLTDLARKSNAIPHAGTFDEFTVASYSTLVNFIFHDQAIFFVSLGQTFLWYFALFSYSRSSSSSKIRFRVK